MSADFEYVMAELEKLGSPRQKKYYINQGAKEPVFGAATGAMKAIMKQTGKSQPLAEKLYATGNYDAMYFAGMIAEPGRMAKQDFDRWMEGAYFYMISDFIVAVTLAEAPIAQQVADEWIADGRVLYQSAGWSCYEWLLGTRPDSEFDEAKLLSMLHRVEAAVHTAPGRARQAMNNFLIAVGVSYLPLHGQAKQAAERIGTLAPDGDKTGPMQEAAKVIQTAADKGRLGFKRKSVRC